MRLRDDAGVSTSSINGMSATLYKDVPRPFISDHYNGFVIHPMLVQVLKTNVAHGRRDRKEYDLAYSRMQRYAEIQETPHFARGTFPVIGRSSTYRVGAFQPLAASLSKDRSLRTFTRRRSAVRLTAVMKNVFVPATFTAEGGFTRLCRDKQAAIADSYTTPAASISLLTHSSPRPPRHRRVSGPPRPPTDQRSLVRQTFKRDHAADS